VHLFISILHWCAFIYLYPTLMCIYLSLSYIEVHLFISIQHWIPFFLSIPQWCAYIYLWSTGMSIYFTPSRTGMYKMYDICVPELHTLKMKAIIVNLVLFFFGKITIIIVAIIIHSYLPIRNINLETIKINHMPSLKNTEIILCYFRADK